ncbi:MAG: hypothetical protein JSS24_00405 [Proteobacteria bacterium]|nr:hypothetical protein [Pseudomonadota bacterium]
MRRSAPITFVQLMTASERALWSTDAHPDYYRVPVSRLLDDGRQYQMWEASYARQMREVAHCNAQVAQAMELRKIALRLIHRRGLVDYLRSWKITGDHRVQLFNMFYGCTDYREAVITEHRHYVMAASSGLCTEVLVDAVNDSNGFKLLARYQQLYAQYFQMFSEYSRVEYRGEVELAAALKPTMLEHRSYANLVRRQILVQPPMKARLRFTPLPSVERAKSFAMLG